jgi:Uma2 family endonuclease
MNALQKRFRIEFPDFESFLTQRPDEERWELHDGATTMMTPPAIGHQVIVRNIVAFLTALTERQPERPWRAFPGVGVRHPTDRLSATVPDVVVLPTPVRGAQWATNPLAVFEVLSPTTEAIDRGFKRGFYASIPTLADYIIVDQRRWHVVHFSRAAGFAGQDLTTASDVARLTACAVDVPLARIYHETGLVPPVS